MTQNSIPLSWSPLAGNAEAPSGAALEPVAFLDRAAAERVGDAWLDLARRAAEENPFLEPDILLPALRHLDPAGRVRVAMVAGRGGVLTGLAPVLRRPLGRLAPGLSVFVHEFGPLGAPLLDAVEAEGAAASLLASQAGRSVQFPFLPRQGAAAAALLQAAAEAERPATWATETERAMVDRLASGSADLRRELPTRRRKELARQMRRLADMGRVTITTVRDAPAVRHAFEEFLKLEAGGWKGRRGTALASDPHRIAFARDVVFRRSGQGGCHVAAIRLDGRPVAMLVSFLGTATVATWKIAYDERFARFSPGAQMMLEAAASFLAEPNVQRIDSLAAADHPMIDHLWRDRLAVGTLVVGPARGRALYQLGLAGLRMEEGLRTAVRRLRRALPRTSNMENAS